MDGFSQAELFGRQDFCDFRLELEEQIFIG